MHIAILGAGPGGYEAALYAAKLGARVTLIEERELGGTCLNRGCIPTKALLASAECFQAVKAAGTFGIVCGESHADFAAVIERKNTIVRSLISGIEYLMNANKVTVIKGRGTLAGKNKLRVTTAAGCDEITADNIIIAAGSVPAIPEFFQYDGTRVITSDEALALNEIPKSIIIAGGGVIGCEMGQFFKRMGSDVTIVEMMPHLLPQEDDDCAKQIERQFKKERIKVLCARGISSVEKTDSSIKALLSGGETLEAEKLLVSIGRRSAANGIALEQAGIACDEKGFIPVDGFMQTCAHGIYAIGDIVASAQLAHVASKEARIAVEHILGETRAAKQINYKAVPRCVYTEPQVACVGLTESQAKENGVEYKTGKFNFIALGKAKTSGKPDGFAKIITDKNDVILGAAIIGSHATEMICALTLAVQYGLTAEQTGGCMFPHPTLSEAIMEAAHDVHGKSIHKAEVL